MSDDSLKYHVGSGGAGPKTEAPIRGKTRDLGPGRYLGTPVFDPSMGHRVEGSVAVATR